MKKIVLISILFNCYLLGTAQQIIADHSIVDDYDLIPQQYIDEVKKMFVVLAGESHSAAYRTGLAALEVEDARFQVNILESGTPESYTNANLRFSRATWGDISNETGWIYGYGEEDWCTYGNYPTYTYNPAAVARTKAGISYCHNNNLTMSAFGFGHCYDDGSNLASSYIQATKEYITYCTANNIPTKVFFTTGPIDAYMATGATGYDQYIKWQIIRDSVANNPSRILFDYADILSYNNAGQYATETYNGHVFPTIHTDNETPVATGHISSVGAVRIAKAMWWMLARLAGWNGERSNTYYVSPSGNDSNDGSLAHPWLTWQYAVDNIQAGDTLYFRGGVYNSISPVNITISGTRNSKVHLFGYPADIASGNWPILDCYQHCDNWTNPWDFYNAGIILSQVQYLHLKNLEIRNVIQCDAVLNGAITADRTANITYEQMRVHHSGMRGYWHQTGAWNYKDSIYAVDSLHLSIGEATAIFPQPDTTRWINCDTWDVCDTISNNPGNGGDCWKVISSMGNYYEWNGCRAWNYSDDGFDPNKGERVFINCWAMSSNKYSIFNIEGNGFKTSNWRYYADDYYHNLPDANSKRLVKTKGCLAMFCPGTGFYHGVESDSTDNAYWINNTSYKNGYGFTSRHLYLDSIGDVFRNNIAYGSTYRTATDIPYDCNLQAKYVLSNNTWTRTTSYPYFDNTGIVTNADFAVTDSATLVSLFTASRQSNGELPINKPLRLAPTSDMIDAGTIIPESDSVMFYPLTGYLGLVPDIGYAEYDTTIVLPNDSLLATNANNLNSILNAAEPGDVIYIGSQTISGVINAQANGTLAAPIHIRPASGIEYPQLDTVNISGDYYDVSGITTTGKVTITGDRVTLANDTIKGGVVILSASHTSISGCQFETSDTIFHSNRSSHFTFTGNTVTGAGNMIIDYPTTDKDMRNHTINNNTYISSGNGLRWNGKTWWWYISTNILRGFDINSTHTKQ